ncbi:hypothetical protein HGP29_27900 [Flammeovirga sp. SR4]|uniref:Uncharacterized protein n=2 Tax=Flammeovirga agarivorans TaxID=2726742 RepID=A0A7X8SRG0_9BACT|nr:hypothetical protein [Flammeovirga agarivorans]
MTSMAWSIHSKDMLYLPLWITTIIGLILYLVTKQIGNKILILVSILWLLQLAETLGWFLTFKPEKIAFIGLPTLASILIVIFGTNKEFKNRKKVGFFIKAIALIIPILGTFSYSYKTYDRAVFSEFYGIDNTKYKAVFKRTPSSTRQFEIDLSVNELRDLVKNKATFVANHHYFPNARLKVNMRFSKINEIELYQIEGYELEQPIKWKIDELSGETEFL